MKTPSLKMNRSRMGSRSEWDSSFTSAEEPLPRGRPAGGRSAEDPPDSFSREGSGEGY